MLAAGYEEVIVDRLFAGKPQLTAALQPLMEAAETTLALDEAKLAAIPGLKISVTNRIVRGNELTVEWVATGEHTGDYPGLPATGRAFAIPGVTVVVREQYPINLPIMTNREV